MRTSIDHLPQRTRNRLAFVVQVLQEVFDMPPGRAAATMLAIHQGGKAFCGFNHDVDAIDLDELRETGPWNG